MDFREKVNEARLQLGVWFLIATCIPPLLVLELMGSDVEEIWKRL